MEKGKSIILIIIFVILLAIVGAGGWYMGKKYANYEDEKSKTAEKKENKNSENQEENKNNNSLILTGDYIGSDNGLYGLYDNNELKLINKNLVTDNFYIDGDTLYYTDIDGNLHSSSIKDPKEEIKNYDIKIVENHFSVKDNKIYYISSDNGKQAAYTIDLSTGKVITKNKLDISFAETTKKFDGDVTYLTSQGNVFDAPNYYSYNFTTNKLTKVGPYNSIIENKKDSILFEKNNGSKVEYCLYSKTETKELFCLNTKNIKQPDQVYEALPTTDGKAIYVISDNEVVAYTSGEDKTTKYTLTEEEQKADLKNILSVKDHLYLIIGTNEVCEEGCAYDLVEYDLNNDKEKLTIQLETGIDILYFVD